MTEDLVRRLRVRREHGDMMYSRMLLVNPDGDEAAARIEALEGALRNVAAHATGGAIQNGHSLGLNDLCVQISAHHNRIWNAALAKDKSDG